MKKRILTSLCVLALIIMTSAIAVFAEETNFVSPKDGDCVLIGDTVDLKYVVGFTAANNQTYCTITIESPSGGDPSTAFTSDSVYNDFEAEATFTPTEEGTYKITSVCGNYIIMNMGMFSRKLKNPITTETISIKAVKTYPSGTVLENEGVSYKVLKDTKTVAYAGPANKSATSVVIPASVKISGKTYKVTSIDSKAFYGCKKLKKVTIGKNFKSIGKSAFEKCSKLKTIIIKSTSLKLKTVGAKAFKGINAKATAKVPKKKLKTYKTILIKRGAKKTIKVKA